MAGKSVVLISLLLILVGSYFAYDKYSFFSSSKKVMARVSHVEKRHRSINPTFEYVVNGKTYTIEGANTRSDEYELNDQQLIFYNPNDPSDARVGTFMNMWFVPVLLLGLGIIFFIVGIVTWLATGKKKSPAFSIKTPGS